MDVVLCMKNVTLVHWITQRVHCVWPRGVEAGLCKQASAPTALDAMHSCSYATCYLS